MRQNHFRYEHGDEQRFGYVRHEFTWVTAIEVSVQMLKKFYFVKDGKKDSTPTFTGKTDEDDD